MLPESRLASKAMLVIENGLNFKARRSMDVQKEVSRLGKPLRGQIKEAVKV